MLNIVYITYYLLFVPHETQEWGASIIIMVVERERASRNMRFLKLGFLT